MLQLHHFEFNWYFVDIQHWTWEENSNKMLHNVFLWRLQLRSPPLTIFYSLQKKKKKKSWCTLLPDERKMCHKASILWQLLMKLQCSTPLKKYNGYFGRRCVSRCYHEMWLNVVLLILLVISVAMPKHNSQL